MHRDLEENNVFPFQDSKMTVILLSLLLAAPVLPVAGGPVNARDHNGTVPLVLWHGMGEGFYFQIK